MHNDEMIKKLTDHAGAEQNAAIELHYHEGVGWYVSYISFDDNRNDFVTKTYSELSTALEVAISRI